MMENMPTGVEEKQHQPSKNHIYGILLLAVALLVAFAAVCMDSIHSVDPADPISSETESGTDECQDVAALPGTDLDRQVDSELTTAFTPSFRDNYLSGLLLGSSDISKPVEAYMDLVQIETTAGNPEDEATDQADPATAEPETEEPEQVDPRTTVWDHYPNLGVVVAPHYLHIRTAPSMDGTIVGILFNMSGVNLLELSEDGQWYHIVSNGIEGYINAGYVATGEEARTLAYDNCFAAVTVNAEVLNVRQEPTTESAILTQIRAGSLYEVSEETNDEWLKVVISGEIEGYVSREFVTYDYALQDAVAYTEPEAEPEPEEVEEEVPAINPVRLDLVNNAMQYLGGAYVWGGTTLGKGVDCSGFVLRIFEQYGYSLPRTSYWQVNSGIAVSFEEMQPGDLIFYWNNSLGRIGHVAIYIGNNLIIHAASAQRGIVIDDYRFMTPYCARNIIGE